MAELGERMGGAEFVEWQVYDAIYGLGDPNELAALIRLTIAQALGGRAASKYTIEDFMPRRVIKEPVKPLKKGTKGAKRGNQACMALISGVGNRVAAGGVK